MTSSSHINAIAVQRDEYPGNAAFRKIVDFLRHAWERLPDKARYIPAFGDEEIAIVLPGIMGPRAFEWFHEKIGALGECSALDVWHNEAEGPRIIRSLLLRMPPR
jgi:hypothetical protein